MQGHSISCSEFREGYIDNNWLGDRQQRVVIERCISDWESVTSGIPQVVCDLY